jgi:predicted nucleic acid-binding protein
VVFFMRPKEEEGTRLFLSQFKTAPVNQEVMDQAAAFYRKWNPSHGMDINNALLAATALLSGGHIFCLNEKHYPMPDMVVRKAW